MIGIIDHSLPSNSRNMSQVNKGKKSRQFSKELSDLGYTGHLLPIKKTETIKYEVSEGGESSFKSFDIKKFLLLKSNPSAIVDVNDEQSNYHFIDQYYNFGNTIKSKASLEKSKKSLISNPNKTVSNKKSYGKSITEDEKMRSLRDREEEDEEEEEGNISMKEVKMEKYRSVKTSDLKGNKFKIQINSPDNNPKNLTEHLNDLGSDRGENNPC